MPLRLCDRWSTSEVYSVTAWGREIARHRTRTHPYKPNEGFYPKLELPNFGVPKPGGGG